MLPSSLRIFNREEHRTDSLRMSILHSDHHHLMYLCPLVEPMVLYDYRIFERLDVEHTRHHSLDRDRSVPRNSEGSENTKRSRHRNHKRKASDYTHLRSPKSSPSSWKRQSMASEVVVRHIGPVSSPTFTQYGRELISTGRNHGLVCVLGLRGGYRLPHHDSGIWDKACANQVAPTHGVGTVTSREVMHDVDLSLRSGGKDGMILLWRRLTLVRHHETDQERRLQCVACIVFPCRRPVGLEELQLCWGGCGCNSRRTSWGSGRTSVGLIVGGEDGTDVVAITEILRTGCNGKYQRYDQFETIPHVSLPAGMPRYVHDAVSYLPRSSRLTLLVHFLLKDESTSWQQPAQTSKKNQCHDMSCFLGR